VVNLYTDEAGNSARPESFRKTAEITPPPRPKRLKNKVLAITVVGLVIIGGLLAWKVLRLGGHLRVEGGAPATLNANGLAGARPSIPHKSIAVLPFENLSDDKSNAYFAEGIQDEILTRLSKIAALKVISRTSTQKYKSAPDNL